MEIIFEIPVLLFCKYFKNSIYSGKIIIIYMHIVYVFLKKQIVKNMPPLQCLEALFFPELNNCNWKEKN